MDPCGGSAQIETDGMAITGQSEMDGMDGLRGRPEADGGRGLISNSNGGLGPSHSALPWALLGNALSHQVLSEKLRRG